MEYKFLKAVIEGGVETRPENVLIYATSNRRHLVRETWKDKADMEHDGVVHGWTWPTPGRSATAASPAARPSSLSTICRAAGRTRDGLPRVRIGGGGISPGALLFPGTSVYC